ncbi:MAG: YbhB/YbcL family Raf kinase inhibitor-like protein [Solirubrobacteraceae bacterium]
MLRGPHLVAALAAAAPLLGACGSSDSGSSASTAPAPATAARPAHRALAVTSPAFASGGRIPVRFTCDGNGSSPPLRWSAAPRGTKSIAVVMTDPDAPGGTFVHWAVWGLPASARGLPAAAKPALLRAGRGTSGRVGYEPPCPPKGAGPHRYAFTVTALRSDVPAAYGAAAGPVRGQIARRTLARGQVVGRYGR